MTGQQFKNIRVISGLNKKELAERMLISESSVDSKESGRRKVTKRDIKILNDVMKERLEELIKSFDETDRILRKYMKEANNQ